MEFSHAQAFVDSFNETGFSMNQVHRSKRRSKILNEHDGSTMIFFICCCYCAGTMENDSFMSEIQLASLYPSSTVGYLVY
ncbi:hypothetical protein ACS0TY_018410 [Phlomoides rotata]